MLFGLEVLGFILDTSHFIFLFYYPLFIYLFQVRYTFSLTNQSVKPESFILYI